MTGRAARTGFTLVEVIATLGLLSLVVAVTGPLLLRIAGMSTTVTRSQERTAAAVGQATRIAALPFDGLAGAAGCTTFASAAFPHRRCITVTDTLPQLRKVTIIITPLDSTTTTPDSIVLYRVNLARANPFNSL